MDNISINPDVKHDQREKELGCPSSNLQRYRHDMKIQNPYKNNASERTQKTSNDLKRPQTSFLTSEIETAKTC